jgi:hypothetical protein
MNATENLLADFLTQEEAAAELKICKRTLDRWRRLDEGPPMTKLGRRILYRRSSLQAWLHGCEHPTHRDDGRKRSPSSTDNVTVTTDRRPPRSLGRNDL